MNFKLPVNKAWQSKKDCLKYFEDKFDSFIDLVSFAN